MSASNAAPVPIRRAALRGLYAITPSIATPAEGENLLAHIKAYLEAGGRILQWRNKHLDAATQHKLAAICQAACTQHDALFIVNDNLALAQALDADGLHIGREDGELTPIRQAWDGLLGVSCYNQLDLGQAAIAAGADYIAFGSIFASPTKPQAVNAALDLFYASQGWSVPRVAIGGMTPDNVGQVIAAGADAYAVITALFDLRQSPSHTTAQTQRFLAAAVARQ